MKEIIEKFIAYLRYDRKPWTIMAGTCGYSSNS